MENIEVNIDPNFIGEDVDNIQATQAPLPVEQLENKNVVNNDQGLRRSRRIKEKNKFTWYRNHYDDDSDLDMNAFLMKKTRLGVLNNAFINRLDWSNSSTSPDSHWKRFDAFVSRNMDHTCNTLESFHPLILSAKANADDNPKWFAAVNGPYADKFYEGMVTELQTLEEIGAWIKVARTRTMNVLKSTWAFKIKRFPNGLVRKFKARFCVRGDMQIEGVDFDETYAPVINWITVRTLLYYHSS